MPSSKSVDRYHEFLRTISAPQVQVPALQPKTSLQKNVVSFDQWFDQNHDHLADIYRTLQDACQTTGRFVFDRDTCGFMKFCEVAYKHSYKYPRNDENYDENYDEEYDETNDTIVFD